MKKKKLAMILAAALLSSALVGCEGSPAKTGGQQPQTQTQQQAEVPKAEQPQVQQSAPQGKSSAVFVVTGQLGDKSFNDSANRGVQMLKNELGWDVKVVEIGRDQTKWEPTMLDLAEGGEYSLIITNGSAAAEIVQMVADEFPEQNFLMFDSELEANRYPNIYAISYKQNEGSFVAGALAALVTTSSMPNANEEKKIGFIGGSEHPIITDFLVGYVEGAKSVVPDIKVMVSYIGSWDDTAKGKEVAMAQFNQGVDITFPAAEQAGLGCVEAAKEMGKYIIGVDSDQSMLFQGVDEDSANVILTSVLKNVDKSILRAGRLYDEGNLPLGTFESLGIVEDGAGIAYNEYYEKNVPKEIRDKVEEARELVVSGSVQVTSALSDPKAADEIINSVKP